MICSSLSSTLGFYCEPLNDDGDVAMISTPFAFHDGEPIPIFVEKTGNRIRFFDDGGVLLHLRGKGIRLNDQRNLRTIRNLAEPGGITLTSLGELEIWSDQASAPTAFAKYMSAMLAVTGWERSQTGVSTDMSLLLDEVALYLRSWKPSATIHECPEYTGVSGYKYKLDFDVDGEAVIAITPHPNTVSSTAKKLLDIRAAPENAGLRVLIVIDDRRDAETAKREGKILDSVANILMMSRLERNSGVKGQAN